MANIFETKLAIKEIEKSTQMYVPGYQKTVELKKLGAKTMCQIQVTGSGHYLPTYAETDIINCAALEVIKHL